MKKTLKKDLTALEALKELFPDCSRATFSKWLKINRVEIDGQKVKRLDTLVKKGSTLEVLSKPSKNRSSLPALYRDEHIIVVDKPAGLLSVKSDHGPKNSLHDRIKSEVNGKVFVVHRLDKETSGVILYALTEKAYQHLKKQFFEKSAKRTYAALIEGTLNQSKGTWTSYLFDEGIIVKIAKNKHLGKKAVAKFERLAEGELYKEPYSLLKVQLETGRKNQIRVQAEEAGVPVAGDKKYGSQSDPIRRLGLHAAVLEFMHPITKKKMRISSKIPPAFFKPFKNKSKSLADAFEK